jgi:hypothetical protein
LRATPDTSPGPEKLLFGWLRKQAHAAWLAWIAYRSSFVFTEEFQGWPVVRHIAPGVLRMKAPYIGPRRVQSFSGWKPPVLTGLGLAVLYWFVYRHISPTPEDLAGATAGAAVYTCLISIPFWRMARKTRLVVRFDQGAISWRGPDRIKRLVKPEEPRGMQVIPHRWANEERQKHDSWRASHPGQPGPKPLFQISSELVMNTGPGGMNWLTVAEFCNDENREQAFRLQMAIEHVTAAAAEELAAMAREAAQ